MKYKTLHPQQISYDNNADPHGVCRVAGAVQGKRQHRFLLHLMHHVILKFRK